MGFFTVGNILTLAIVLLILILYRQMDRSNRNLKLLRDYSEKLKKELSSYMEEQEKAVKDYGISLNVERDSARELMKHLQITEEELAEKAQAVARIDSQIKSYEDSLAELDKMTGRVQENMNRVRDESAFVDSTGKRISEARARLEEIESELKDLEKRFESENAESLEKTAKSMISAIKSDVSDLSATAETIERKVDDHREAINKIIDDNRGEIDKMVGGHRETMNKIVGDNREIIDRMLGDHLETMNQMVGDNQETIDKMVGENRGTIDKMLGDHLETMNQMVGDSRETIDKMVSGHRETMDQIIKDNHGEIDKMVGEHRGAIDTIVSDNRETIDKMVSGHRETMNQIIKDNHGEIDKMVGEHRGAIDTIVGDNRETIDKMVGEHSETMNQIIKDNHGEIDKMVSEHRGAIDTIVSDNRETIDKMLGEHSETIKRNVEEHKATASKIEETRIANMTRDLDHINKVLSEAMDQAVKRADKMEDAAFTNLKDQAEDRIRKLKTSEEERLKDYHESAKARVAEVQNLVKSIKEEWKAERNDWDAKDKVFRDERKKDIQELNSLLTDSEKRFTAAHAAIEKRLQELSVRADEILTSHETALVKSAEEMKHKALETVEAKLEEYRRAQDAEFRRLETLSEDSRNLDAELRRGMQEVVNKAQEDFAKFEAESTKMQKTAADGFSIAAAGLREQMEGIERDLADLKSAAYENVSEKLKIFEDDFFSDIKARSVEIDQRLLDWQENFEKRLSLLGEESEIARTMLERNFIEEMQKNFSAQGSRLTAELEHLKSETSAFEEGIRGQMNAADELSVSFREQLNSSFEDARKEAEISIKSEIGKYSLTAAETIKLYQRELDGKFHEISEYIETRNVELSGLVDASRADLEKAKNDLSVKIRELDDTIEDTRRRVRELESEAGDRITVVRASVEDAERHIRETLDQTKLIDKADGLRKEMETRIEDLRGDIDRLEQRRSEALQLENDFVKITRLANDVNAKMTRFVSEQRRIETMEAAFNRLILTSKAVEEKLTQVTSSDDTLQGVQLQIRKLEESLAVTEEKYQRIEKKNQILDNTNDGIDKNFRILQDSEKLSTKIGGDLERFSDDIESIRTSIEKLSGESNKAREAMDKIDLLDNALEEIGERTEAMQRARTWIADAEKRLEDLNKQALTQARAIDALVKGKKSGPPIDKGSKGSQLSKQQIKENVIALRRNGWDLDEIAKTMKLGLGEVELILETAPKE